jgi:hypothetical protein
MIGMTVMVGWSEAKVDGRCFLKTPCGVRDESLWGLGVVPWSVYMYVYLKGAVEDEFRREWNIGMDVAAWKRAFYGRNDSFCPVNLAICYLN